MEPGVVADRPTGTVTFLFTDVEGSTRAWDSHPEQMNAAVALHDQIVRRCVTAHRGYVFATAGDSFSVAFPTAGDGVRAALSVQHDLAAAAWPDHVVLAVRMGLHTGHANERGGDYFGPAVNRAARLMATAHGGQVVCSHVTAQLARPDLGDRVELHDLGEVRLKDLLDPEQVFGVVGTGLTSAFPALQSLDRARHNLPVQRSRLIGRDADVARIIKVMHEHRVITLTGIGGCGKTRLALAVAAEVSELFEDGACFVELAPVADGERVAEVVTEALGVRVGSGATAAERLAAIASFLARRDVLIVLDNCEHLLDPVAELVEAIMSSGTQARVLATSREALEVDGEQTHRVSSLDAGTPGRDGDDSPALELLLERAGAMHTGLQFDGADRLAAIEICRRLDGLPLAIELAAAQLGLFGPQELLARLDRRFELLVGGRNRRRQRQQTLQAVMDWSWELLTGDEQRLLAWLSVFSGGWTLDAAEGVCWPLSLPLPASLRSLVAKSLVEPTKGPNGTRYRMLETVRLFAQQKLVDLGEPAAARQAHGDWFVAWVEAVPFDERLLSVAWHNRMMPDLDNLFAAVDWALDAGNVANAACLVGSSGGLFVSGIASAQGVRWTSRLIACELEAGVRGRVLVSGSLAAVSAGTHDLVEGWAKEAAALSRDREPIVESIASTWQATPLMLRAPDRVPALLERAREAAVAADSALCRGFSDAWAVVAEFCVAPQESSVVSPLDAARFGGAHSLGWNCAIAVGVMTEALLGRLDLALEIASNRSPLSLMDDLSGIHEVLATAIAGDPEQAIGMACQFIRVVDRLGDVMCHAELVLVLGIIRLRLDDAASALSYFEAAKRAPMFGPHYYRVLVDQAALARTAIADPAAIAAAVARGRALGVEAILDLELRTPR